MTLGSIRHHIRIDRPADTVWALAGDPTRLHEWFPGIASCQVDGNIRTIVLDSGLPAAIKPTIYARLGDIPAAILVATALIIVIRRRAAKAVL